MEKKKGVKVKEDEDDSAEIIRNITEHTLSNKEL